MRNRFGDRPPVTEPLDGHGSAAAGDPRPTAPRSSGSVTVASATARLAPMPRPSAASYRCHSGRHHSILFTLRGASCQQGLMLIWCFITLECATEETRSE
jgi:hypothetical protein